MTHLAARGIICPQPAEEPERRGAKRTGRPARGDHQFSRRHLAAQAQRRALRRRRPGAGEDASGGPRFRDDRAPTRCRCRAGVRCSIWPRRAPTSCSTACATFIARRARLSRKRRLAEESAARRDPRRPVSGQRVLSRREGVRPDRFHLRLQRHAGLRRRDLPQRLVFRDGSFLQRHQGARLPQRLWPRAAIVRGRAERAAAAGARRGAALPADAAGRFSQRAAGRAGEAEGSARICPQAALPAERRQHARLRRRDLGAAWREFTALASPFTPTAPARAIPAPAAGARS